MTVAELTLEEAIEQMINLGEKDPPTIVQRLRQHHGDDWIAEHAEPYLDDLIANMARLRVNANRRLEVARITPAGIARQEILLQRMWVPSEDGFPTYVRVSEATPSDFERRAAYLRRMAGAIGGQADWCEAMAVKLRGRGLSAAGELPLDEWPPLVPVRELEVA